MSYLTNVYLYDPTMFLKPREVINTFPDLSNFPLDSESCDFHIFQTVKLSRDIQGDILVTIYDHIVIINIVTTIISMFTDRNNLLLPVNFFSQKVF